ncbi:MAG: ABC transporter permease [Miniphocaeibacter sp.]|uniref:ABC transporter permease n=1 Tax=Miniphocaeibacter sp. TaxID=3100973 RepID=UPI0017C5782D|nr:ABC transporter permease [Gallicola sp.]
MKITAKLAYSQLKVNRLRTFWTMVGVILSTALITAVCSFGASGYALIKDFLDANKATNNFKIMATVAIPVGILSIIIVAMSVAVISNAFRVSAGERTTQFGILKSVGATKKQIVSTVMSESIFISLVSIPLGILFGLFLAFLGVQVANHFLGELNSLAHIMMHKLIIVFDFIISWQALVIATVISFSTILLSAWLPARKAAKSYAIDSIRGKGEVKLERKMVKTNPLIGKIFGFEGVLAAKNMKRSKRNLRSTVISLTVGVILFINLGFLSNQVNSLMKMMSLDNDAAVIVDYTSMVDNYISEKTGEEGANIVEPINSELGDEITEKLREYNNTRIFAYGGDMETYNALVPKGNLRPIIKEVLKESEITDNELSAELITVDKENYEKLCEKAGVSIGSNILLNYYDYNDNGKQASIKPFEIKDKNFKLIEGNGSIKEIKVHGELNREEIPRELFVPNTNIVRLVVPQGEMRGYNWFSTPKDIDGFIDYANGVMNEVFPETYVYEYGELGYRTSVYKTDDFMKVMNIPIVLATVFLYSFIALLALIGLTNIISTMATNVRVRSKEFAVLQSVGMTPEGLKRMLNLESIMYSYKSLAIGLPVGILFTYLISKSIRTAFPIPYKLPWLMILISIVVVFAITWITMQYSLSKIKNKNIIETIRLEK